MRTVILAVVVLVGTQAHAIAANPPVKWKGLKVMPKLDAEVKVDNEAIDYSKSGFALPWRVQDVDGDLLLIGSHRKGWVQKSQVVTLDEAPAYYTQFVKRHPHEAWAYDMRAMAWRQKGDLNSAIADYGEELRLAPDAVAYNNRGLVWMDKKEYDKAAADFNQAMRLDPNSALAYNNRGWAWMGKKQYDKALADFNEAIRLDPNDAVAYNNRGWAQSWKKDYEKAIADYKEAMRLDPNFVDPANNTAWLRATSIDARFRNGKEAVEFATKACELGDWKVADNLDTLAAAYAEAGDFDSAIKYESQAIGLNAADAEFVKMSNERLTLYRDHKPYREE